VLGGDKPPPEYSFFATPTVSDTDTASASKSTVAIELLPADSDVNTGALSTVGESFEFSAVSDSATGRSVGLSASGMSKTLDVTASDPVDSSAVAGKSVESVESAAKESSDMAELSVEGSDVHDLRATSTPYISSDLADAVSITETDNTGEVGTTAAAESALLHTEETETLDLGTTGGTVDTSLEVVASDAETEDTGESVAISASDPSSIVTTNADVAQPTATVDSTDRTVPTASTSSVSSVPASVVVLPPSGAVSHSVVDSDSDSESEMADSQSSNQFSPKQFRGLITENAKDWIRQFDNVCTYKAFEEQKKMALFKVLFCCCLV